MSDDVSLRRQFERVQVNKEFESIEEFITEYVSDLSYSGAFIRTDDPLPVGTKVDLRFTVIVEDFESIEGIGEVVRVVPPGQSEPPGMAVVFTELTEFSRQNGLMKLGQFTRQDRPAITTEHDCHVSEGRPDAVTRFIEYKRRSFRKQVMEALLSGAGCAWRKSLEEKTVRCESGH